MPIEQKEEMIEVTHLNRSSIVLNSDLIVYIENTPDTVITLTNDRKITVLDTPEEIVNRVRAWRQSLVSAGESLGMEMAHG